MEKVVAVKDVIKDIFNFMNKDCQSEVNIMVGDEGIVMVGDEGVVNGEIEERIVSDENGLYGQENWEAKLWPKMNSREWFKTRFEIDSKNQARLRFDT